MVYGLPGLYGAALFLLYLWMERRKPVKLSGEPDPLVEAVDDPSLPPPDKQPQISRASTALSERRLETSAPALPDRAGNGGHPGPAERRDGLLHDDNSIHLSIGIALLCCGRLRFRRGL
jgi:hypothetical protein